jgi:dihydroflavonol-4-reductase
LKPTLVTGATGFIGWHVAKNLAERGYKVRALARPSSEVRELDVQTVRGDLRDPTSLEQAVSGCGVVFHIAADYRLWAKDPAELFDSNVNGTKNLLSAAQAAGVERVVYTSTVGCIGIPPGGLGAEDTPVSIDDMTGSYKQSKFQAEQVALEFAAAGLPVVIVNPTAPVGDHDFKPTPTGKIILDFLKGAMPAFVDTGLNFVDVQDTALGHLLALEHGKPGERYILGSENLTLHQMLERLAAVTGGRAPRLKIPHAVAYAAGMASTGWANLTGQEPRVPIDAVRMSRTKVFVSLDKAKRDLNFNPQPVNCALTRAVDWFRANGYV